MLRLAAILYSLFTGGAVLWCWLAGRFPWPLYDPNVSSPTRLALGLGAGLGCAAVVVLLSRAMVAHLRWAQQLYRFFREALGPLDDLQVLALALLSAIGEELFFRGAMQPAWGIWPATLIFAVLHFPSRLQLWSWTVMAGVLGLAFGYMTQLSGSVAGATIAHFLVNLLNLRHIARMPLDEEKLPLQDPAPSMGDHEAHVHPPRSHRGDDDGQHGEPGQRAEP